MTKRPSSFSEAFQVLDEALLLNPKPDFGPLVSREVKLMREQVGARAQATVEHAQVALSAGTDQAKAALAASAEQAKVAFDAVSEHAVDFTKAAGKEISENPVPYLAAAAAGALIIGFLIASPKRKAARASRPAPARKARPKTSRVLAKDLKPMQRINR